MMLGLLLVALFASVGVSATLYFLDAPLWQVLVAYPLTGVAVLLLGALLAHSLNRKWFSSAKSQLFRRLPAGSAQDNAHGGKKHPKIGHH